MDTLKLKFITLNHSARLEKRFELAKQDNLPSAQLKRCKFFEIPPG
jgi:hypothetical protein